MSAGAAAIGGISIDTTVGVDGVLAAKVPGGNAAYGAWAASIWMGPGRSHLVANVGQDFPLPWLAAFADTGIDVRSVSVVPGLATPTWQVAYSDGDHRTDLTISSTDASADREDIRDAGPGELDPRIVGNEPFLDEVQIAHCCPVAPHVLLVNLLPLRQRGCVVLVDPGEESADWTTAETDQVLADADIYCPSADDLDPVMRVDPVAAAVSLSGRGPATVVIKLGSAGSIVRSAGATTHIPAAAASVIDPTGAGDSYCGAFAAAFSRFGDPVVAAVLASATASFAVEARGVLGCLRTAPSAVLARAERLADRAGVSLPELSELSST